MKITKTQLRIIIKEELESTLSELTAKPEGYKSIGHFPEEIGGSRMPRIYAPPDYQQMMQKGKDFKVYLRDKTGEYVNTKSGNYFLVTGQALQQSGEQDPERALISVLRSQG
mgnify:CR=1 FL=1